MTPSPCLLTLHGIGFQQAPTHASASDGYADDLHRRLRSFLGKRLGDDPQRPKGPVYVQAAWPPTSNATDAGLRRLGTWNADRLSVGTDGAALTAPDGSIAHVALVYSRLEGTAPDHDALTSALLSVLPSISQYATVAGLIRMAVRDIGAVLGQHDEGGGRAPLSLRRRTDMPVPGHHSLRPTTRRAPTPAPPSGPLATLHLIEDDVAAYVARNQLRERVRAFVREAIMRLAARADVSTILVNAHSNGTVIAFDVLSQLPRNVSARIGTFVTAGSPLRKYVELLGWGTDAGGLSVQPWRNYWDPCDPVAEPLQPPDTWRVGEELPADGPGLFTRWDPDTGRALPVVVMDVAVNNVAKTAGGGSLPAHDYWDNDEFCASLAELLIALPGPQPGLPVETGSNVMTGPSNE